MIHERLGNYSEALRWYRRGLNAAESLGDEPARVGHRIALRASNMPAWFQVQPGDTTVSTGTIFGVTGIVLLALAAVFF